MKEAVYRTPKLSGGAPFFNMCLCLQTRILYETDGIQDSEIIWWSSVFQHVLVFTNKRKMFLIHLHHPVYNVEKIFISLPITNSKASFCFHNDNQF